jgi:hypothetical protein
VTETVVGEDERYLDRGGRRVVQEHELRQGLVPEVVLRDRLDREPCALHRGLVVALGDAEVVDGEDVLRLRGPRGLLEEEFDTKGGTREIADGIYSFQTPELRGTIDLINWMNDVTGRNVGVTDLAQGAVQQVSKKATVVFAEQQNISKRFLLRSSSYTECMAEIGHAFINGAVDHMSARRAIRVLGAQGEEWDEITRKDLDFQADIDARIRSTTQEMQDAQLKKEARMKTLSDISLNPVEIQSVNVQWLI